ncbi:MAB_1171c family putative transporter [Streptomyces abikoensis]|uniref:MAB_1171c family putative transporter n=1 Tax=Streptomyces abikoensis TaxID=97398 RepID=UPI0033C8E109
MADVLACLAGLVLLGLGFGRRAALGRRAGTGGRAGTSAQRQAHRFAFCLGTALLLLAPATALTVERAVGLAGLPMLLGDALRMLAIACLGLLTARPVRHQAAAAAAALLVLGSCFSAAGLHHENGLLFVDARHRPLLAAYDAVLIAYPAWQLAALGGAVARRLRQAEPGAPRAGLRLLGAATAVAVIWTAWGLDDVRLALLTGRQTDGDDAVSTVLGLLCALLVTAGGSAAARPALRHWWWAYRSYRALAPLWSVLHHAFPETALPHRHHGLRGLTPQRLRFALYRRVIEIHDGLLLLRPRLPLPVPLPGASEADPDTAAAQITAALRAPLPATAAATASGRLALRGVAGTDMAADQLVAISRSFARLAVGGGG